MKETVGRRTFFQLCSAVAAWMSSPQGAAAAPQDGRRTVHNRKNFVAIQMKPHAWIDEGIEQCLDNLQKGAVNTIWAYTYDWEMGPRNTPNGAIPLPDHGKYGDPTFHGGAFYNYDAKYFRGTMLSQFRSPDYGNWDVIAEVAPKAKARGMDFFCWDYNNESRRMMQNMPNAAKTAEVDILGRRMIGPCFNHPDYRAHQIGKIESYFRQYPSDVAGIAWGCERQGPFQNVMGGGWTSEGIGCFCEHCRAKARERGISVERAKAGYEQFAQLIRAAAQDRRPVDGYFVTFWRMLLEYPEILAWEKLWTDSYQEMRSELYGAAKAIAPEKPFGFHIMQNMTFSPFYRAEEDYSKTKNYADYLKLATYNNAGGPRMKSYMDRLGATIFHDARPNDFVQFYYKIMNYEEGPYETLNTSGLTPDYLRRSVRAAFDAGVDGVVLAREYVEMWLANLSAAGDTLREIFAKRG